MASITQLESNPDVLTKYMHKMGVPELWCLNDVVGLEPELLDWLPRPIKAFILLFPCTDAYKKHTAIEFERMSALAVEHPKELYFMRQQNGNTCGTIALVHSIANNPDIKLKDGILKTFLANTSQLSPEDRGKALENDAVFMETHEAFSQEGQTPADPNDIGHHHFVTILNFQNILYELDGRKAFPIAHGPTSEETFVDDFANICEAFMARDPEDVHFTVMAMTPHEDH